MEGFSRAFHFMKIFSSAPCRISLFGGGTDVDSFRSNYGGATLSFAIKNHTSVIYDNEEWKIFRTFHAGGLGGSASYWVALVAAQMALNHERLDRNLIALRAHEIEKNVFGWHGGLQDQYTSAYGGFLFVQYCLHSKISPIVDKHLLEGFLPWLVLCRMPLVRKSFNVQKGLEQPTKNQIDALLKIKQMAFNAKRLFESSDYSGLAKMLDNGWKLKKESNHVSNPQIDKWYSQAKRIGAIGGKVLGAGQGGHFLFAVEPDNRKNFIRKLPKELYVIDFEPNWTGLEVITNE